MEERINFHLYKIQDAIKSKNIFLNNKGESIRDFIHINDVCKIYKINYYKGFTYY